jgi:O-antigen/teichoic acid export membrane protein
MNFVASRIRWIFKGEDSASATLQTFVSKFLILAINVITGIVVARTLGSTGRGEQAAMILWSGFLASAMTLGLPSALVYNLKRFPEQRSSLVGAALLLGGGLGCAATLIGIVFMPRWLAQYSPEVIYLARWFMLNAPLALVMFISLSAFEAAGDFSTANQIRSFVSFSTLIALVGFALTRTLTPFTSSFAYVFAYLPIFVWMIYRLWRLFQPQWVNFASSCQRLLSYGLRAYSIDLLGSLSGQVDQALVVGLLSPASMGMYVVALSFSRILAIFQGSIVTVLFPKTAARPVAEVVALVGQAARISAVITFLASIGVILLGPLLLHLLYGAEYVGASAVLRVLVVEVVLGCTVSVLAQAFMALGHLSIVTLLQGVGLGLSVPLMLVLIPPYGLTGAGLALLGSTGARLLFILICFPLVLKVPPPSLLIMRQDIDWLRHKILKRNEPQ